MRLRKRILSFLFCGALVVGNMLSVSAEAADSQLKNATVEEMMDAQRQNSGGELEPSKEFVESQTKEAEDKSLGEELGQGTDAAIDPDTENDNVHDEVTNKKNEKTKESGVIVDNGAEVPLPAKAAQSGFVTYPNGNMVYVDPSTGNKVTGFKTIQGYIYYFAPPSGVAVKGLQFINNKYYYFDDKFHQKTGIIEVTYKDGSKQKHYFLESGGKYSGWVDADNSRYYFSSQQTGAVMVYGTQYLVPKGATSGEKYFYFDKTTGKLTEGIYSNNDGVYFYYKKEGGTLTGTSEELVKYKNIIEKAYPGVLLVNWNGNKYILSRTTMGKALIGFQSVGGDMVNDNVKDTSDAALYFLDKSTAQAIKNTTFTYAHIKFSSDANGQLSWVPEEAYKNDQHISFFMNGLAELGAHYPIIKDGVVTEQVPNAFTCGSLVKYLYEKLNYMLPQESWNQAKLFEQGGVMDGPKGKVKAVKISGPVTDLTSAKLKIGDIIFWKVSKDICTNILGDPQPCDKYDMIHHSAVYVGKNSVIEAAQPREMITMSQSHQYEGFEIAYVYRLLPESVTDAQFSDASLSEPSPAMRPSTPENVAAKGHGIGEVKVTWKPVLGSAGYIICAKRTKDGKYSQIGYTIGENSTSFMDKSALQVDYNFYWVHTFVKAADKTTNIYSIPGSYVYAKGILPPITGLKAQGNKNGVLLTWNKSSGARGYVIYGKADLSDTSKQIGITTSTSYTDVNAYSDKYNFYWVYPYHYYNSKPVVGERPDYVYAKKLMK